MGHGERLLHLGENLTLDSLEIDSDVESCLWKVYLGGSSEEVHLEGSNGSMVGQREMLAWDTVNDESIPRDLWNWTSVCLKLRQGGRPFLRFLHPLVTGFRWPPQGIAVSPEVRE